MEESANLALPYIMPSQAQKHLTHNEALMRLDALVHLAVLDRDLTTPPGSPAPGDRHIVGADATGAWEGWDLSVAAFYEGVWLELVPQTGWTAWVEADDTLLLWAGAAWQPLAQMIGAATTAAELAFTPAGNIAADDVQAALEELDGDKVSKAGDTMNGTLTTEVDGVVGVEIVAEGAGNTFRATKHIDAAGGTVMIGRKSRGSKASPTPVQSNDLLLGFRAYGYNGTGGDGFVDANRGAAFLIEASETWDSVKTGTQIRFFVTPNGNGALSNSIEHLRLANDGALQMGGANTVVTASRHPQLRSYTVAGLPSTSPAGQLIYVSNGTGNKRLGISDGTNWRFPDGDVVS